MAPLTALLIADDRPGHYHLSEGVIAAARRLRPIEVVRLTIERRLSGRLLALLTNTGAPAGWMLRAAYGLDPNALPPADFIVSAGAETLAASVAVHRLTGAPNIFYGSLRWFRPRDFALVLTSYASKSTRPRHVMVLKPSALDGRALNSTRMRPEPQGSLRNAALLLGGDSGECQFTAQEWESLLAFVEASHSRFGTRWAIGNSRRTAPSASDAVARRVEAGAPAIARFIDVRTAGPGTLGEVLKGAEAVLCTDDSSSMISECVGAGLPVIGVSPRRQRLSNEEQGYRHYLSENGWYRAVSLADLTPERVQTELAAIKPMTEDPLDRLAALLRERLPTLFADPAQRGPALPCR
jgi:mitochondrial fission protein ELM1